VLKVLRVLVFEVLKGACSNGGRLKTACAGHS
jgi:hypothetical protein